MFNFGGGFGSNLILNRAIKLNKISHAWLFCGEEMTKNEAVAKKFAMAICCKSKQQKPCFNCVNCKKFINNFYVDYLEFKELKYGEKLNCSVENVRQIIQGALTKPIEGEFKFYSIFNVDNFLPSAINALLKILEEPLKHVVFLLTAKNKINVAPTIASRCFCVNLFADGMQTCLKLINNENKFEINKIKEAVFYGENYLEKSNLILNSVLHSNAVELSKKLFNFYFKKDELNFLKYAAKMETDLNLFLFVLNYFCVNLREFVSLNIKKNKLLNLNFVNEIFKVFNCCEKSFKLVLKNCNLKLVLVNFCCEIFCFNSKIE